VLTLDEMEHRHIEQVVRLEGGNIDRAAVRLGVSRSTLYQKLKRYRDESS
jgi:DNA-binding NtrC family response regulator